MKRAGWLVVAAAAALASCDGARAPPSEQVSAATPNDAPRNTEYSFGGRPVRLVDGFAEEPAAPGSAAMIVTRYVGNEARGDLNADGREDVALILTQQQGGSGTFYYAVAALGAERGLIGSHAVLLGDRITPRSTAVQSNGTIVIEYLDRAPGEGFATPPSVAKTIHLKLDPATLQLGELVQDFEREADANAMNLDMKTWTWVRATDNGNDVVPRRADAFTLTFRPDGTFSATTDCNRVMGGYETNDRNLTFGAMAATKMYCADAEESVFTGLLGRTTSYAFTPRGELVLTLDDDSSSLTFR